jgi:hypothetical protein
MMPIRGRLLPFLLAVALLACGAIGTAAALAGELTTFEYQQLITTRDKLKTAKAVSAGIWDCEQIQMQTPLLTDERADCISQLQITKLPSMMQSYVKDCVAYPSATARIQCLLPVYEQFYKEEATGYRAESRIHQIATSRGLGEACADLLSDAPIIISDEQLAVSELAQIIRDIKAGDVSDFESVSKKAVVVLATITKGQQANNASTSICPHPGAHAGGGGQAT